MKSNTPPSTSTLSIAETDQLVHDGKPFEFVGVLHQSHARQRGVSALLHVSEDHAQHVDLHGLAQNDVRPRLQVLGHVILQHIARHTHHQVLEAALSQLLRGLHPVLFK